MRFERSKIDKRKLIYKYCVEAEWQSRQRSCCDPEQLVAQGNWSMRQVDALVGFERSRACQKLEVSEHDQKFSLKISDRFKRIFEVSESPASAAQYCITSSDAAVP